MIRALFVIITIGLSACSWKASAAEVSATCASLPAALKAASGGDTIRLAAGTCATVYLSGRTYDPPLRIVAADPASPPVFPTLRFVGVRGLELVDLVVAFKPTPTTYGHQNLVALESKSSVVLTNVRISATPAVEPALDGKNYATVPGWPLGRGLYVSGGSDVTLQGSEVFGVERGIVLDHAGQVMLAKNGIHDIRRTMIMGDGVDVAILENRLERANPWKYGETPIGDHANYISIQQANALPVRGKTVRIVGNVTSAGGNGLEVLGLVIADADWIEVRENVISGSDHQGIMPTRVGGGVIEDNILLVRGTIYLTDKTANLAVRRNRGAGFADKLKGATGSTFADNTVLQSIDPAKPGYVSPERLAATIAGLSSGKPGAAYASVAEALNPTDWKARAGELESRLADETSWHRYFEERLGIEEGRVYAAQARLDEALAGLKVATAQRDALAATVAKIATLASVAP